MAGAVWVGDPAHKRRMVNITIGGEWHDKVFGGRVPGPIWRDMMSGALAGEPSPDFNRVYIPDERPDRDRGDDDNGNGNGNGNRDDNGNGDDGGGFIGGNDGGTSFPTPDFTIPENWFEGQTNGGNNGNGNGGGGFG